jgi:hypothetical protein
MEKRYQVFVSSTYEDLQEERQEVMHALLELDCIPAGMELFPAANEDQWTLIKNVINDCDYYIVIVGGRYGSVDASGVSYTEKEYRYALEKGKPVIGFLHKNPDELPAKKTERSEENKKKLESFRLLVAEKMCQHWEGPADLGSKVSRSLIKLIKQHPAIGWIRTDQLPSEDTNEELLRLRKRVEELEAQLAEAQTEAPRGTENLAQGLDQFKVLFSFKKYAGEYDINAEEHTKDHTLTWNDIFYAVSPGMMNEASEYDIRSDLSDFIESKTRKSLQQKFRNYRLKYFYIDSDTFSTILVQLKALGLITKSVRQRSVKDEKTYWKLTPYGDTVMTQLRAIRKK